MKLDAKTACDKIFIYKIACNILVGKNVAKPIIKRPMHNSYQRVYLIEMNSTKDKNKERSTRDFSLSFELRVKINQPQLAQFSVLLRVYLLNKQR